MLLILKLLSITSPKFTDISLIITESQASVQWKLQTLILPVLLFSEKELVGLSLVVRLEFFGIAFLVFLSFVQITLYQSRRQYGINRKYWRINLSLVNTTHPDTVMSILTVLYNRLHCSMYQDEIRQWKHYQLLVRLLRMLLNQTNASTNSYKCHQSQYSLFYVKLMHFHYSFYRPSNA